MPADTPAEPGSPTAGTDPADAPATGGRLEELRERLQDIEDVPLGERPALFEELDRRLSEELEAITDRAAPAGDPTDGAADTAPQQADRHRAERDEG